MVLRARYSLTRHPLFHTLTVARNTCLCPFGDVFFIFCIGFIGVGVNTNLGYGSIRFRQRFVPQTTLFLLFRLILHLMYSSVFTEEFIAIRCVYIHIVYCNSSMFCQNLWRLANQKQSSQMSSVLLFNFRRG